MKILTQSESQKIIELLQDNELLILPTDTVYGICTIITNPRGRIAINQTKQRDPDQEIAIIVNSYRMLCRIIESTPYVKKLTKRYKRSITFLNYKNPYSRYNRYAAKGSIAAVRITHNPWLKKIIKKTGPLLASSANLHYKPVFTQVKQMQFFADAVAAVVKADQDSISHTASPIYDVVHHCWVRKLSTTLKPKKKV